MLCRRHFAWYFLISKFFDPNLAGNLTNFAETPIIVGPRGVHGACFLPTLGTLCTWWPQGNTKCQGQWWSRLSREVKGWGLIEHCSLLLTAGTLVLGTWYTQFVCAQILTFLEHSVLDEYSDIRIYLNIFWWIYSFVQIFVNFFQGEYIWIFIRHLFTLTNIFGYSFVQYLW